MTESELPKSPTSGAPRSALFIVFLVVFIDLLGFGIVLPIMPRLAKEYLESFDPSVRGAIIGVLYSSFSLMQFLLSPIWGRLSDRIGRRPIILLGLVGSVVFYGLFAFAVSLPKEQATLAILLILAARIGAGAAGATIGTAAAVIADCTTPEKRAKGMALIGAAFGIGFTFGPLIAYAGLELFESQKWGVGVIASALSAIALLVAYLLLPETRFAQVGAGKERPPLSFKSIFDVLRLPIVGPLILIYFLVIFGFANFESTLALFTGSAFGFDDRENFLVFAYVGLVLMIAQGGIYRPLVGRWKENRMMQLGIGMLFLGLGGMGVVAYGTFQLQQGLEQALRPMFYLAMTTAVVGFAFVNPSVSSLVSRQADPNRQGEILGVSQSGAALGRIAGPLVGSIVFELHPSRTLPYLAAALALMLVLVLLPQTMQPTPDAPKTEA